MYRESSHDDRGPRDRSRARQALKSPEDAILQACVLRFRPIIMTTTAALLGGLPLARSKGPEWVPELRGIHRGIAIVGGLIFSQLLTLYTTPVMYLYLDRFHLRWQAWRGRMRGVAPEVSQALGD